MISRGATTAATGEQALDERTWKIPLDNNEEEEEEEREGAKKGKRAHDNNGDDEDKEVIRGEPAFLFYSTIRYTTRLVGSVHPRAGIVH